MDPLDPTDILVNFLDTRKSKATKNATLGILRYLNNAKQSHTEGWVRAGELQGHFVRGGHLSDSTLFRLLADMEKAGLISKDDTRIEYGERSLYKKKKPSVYYRTEANWETSRWEKYAAVLSDLSQCYVKYDIAIKMLKEAGIKNPKEEIEKRFEKDWGIIRERHKELISELQKSDDKIQKEAKERMKDADLGPGEMLSPWEDLDKEN